MNKTKKARAVPKGTTPLLLLHMADELQLLSQTRQDFVNMLVLSTKHCQPDKHSQPSAVNVARGTDRYALLDVRNHKLHAFDAPDPALVLQLEGEALAFCRMYEGARG